METGESYKHHNRNLLRGYLLVLENAPSFALTEPEPQNSRLHMALELNQRAQQEQLQHLERVRAQQDLILLLARHRYSQHNSLQEAAELITRSACDIYHVDGASLWNLEGNYLHPVSAFQRESQSYVLLDSLDISHFPDYLEALHTSRSIDAHNANRDPRTRELIASHSRHDTNAMLDASIRIDGQVVGVLCLEQVGKSRVWQSDEITSSISSAATA